MRDGLRWCRKAQPFFRPFVCWGPGLDPLVPTVCAVGCILSRLRGSERSLPSIFSRARRLRLRPRRDGTQSPHGSHADWVGSALPSRPFSSTCFRLSDYFVGFLFVAVAVLRDGW